MAILAADAPFSKSPLQGAMAHTDKNGFKVVPDARYPLSTRDLARFIRSLKPINPDILFLAVESRIRRAHLSSSEGETERIEAAPACLCSATPAIGRLQAGELDTNRIETMSLTVSTLLLRNLNDVFGEIDPVRRRAAIDEIFHEDAVFHEPNGIYRGRNEINRIAGVIKATHPDFQYQLVARLRSWATAGGSVGWRVARASRRLSPEPISSLPATARLPPSISFSMARAMPRGRMAL
jgi:hypothetical protein